VQPGGFLDGGVAVSMQEERTPTIGASSGIYFTCAQRAGCGRRLLQVRGAAAIEQRERRAGVRHREGGRND
jgi:hypothetical protein